MQILGIFFKMCVSSMLRVCPFPINGKETIPLWSSPALSQGGFIPFLFPVELGRLDGGAARKH